VTMIFVAGLVFSFVSARTTLFYPFLGLTVLGLLAIVETLMTRVELHDGHIATASLFARRTYPRSEITSVTWAKGSPVSLQLTGTKWVHLPNTGHSSPKVAGAIRAWLNEGGAQRA
jgi:hypothetical protein